MLNWLPPFISRRRLLAGSAAAGGALAARTALGQSGHGVHVTGEGALATMTHGGMITVGEVDHARNGFDPTAILTDWDTGTVSAGRRRPDRCASSRSPPSDKEIEIAPGVILPGLDLQRPGARARRCAPTKATGCASTSRTTARTRTRMHFHGIHAARMDGVPGRRRGRCRARSSSTSSTPSRSAATSTTATRCR